MFDPKDDGVSHYKYIAEEKGISFLQALADDNQAKILANPINWGKAIVDVKEKPKSNMDLLQNREVQFLSLFAKEVSRVVQFPVNTAYLHGLGVLSSAMVGNFTFKYKSKENTVGLYVVTAQPPSTGKTGINDFFFEPIIHALKKYNDKNVFYREKYTRELKKIDAKLSKDIDDHELQEALDKKIHAENKLKEYCFRRSAVSNTTIEALEEVANEQNGVFTIVSAESEAINIVMGAVYDTDSTSKNYGLILNGWGGEYFSSNRISRKGFDGFAKGAIAVLAQAESIEQILSAGKSGRGVTERFLMISESSLLGDRNHLKQTKKMNEDLLAKYNYLVERIVNSKGVVLEFENGVQENIDYIRNKLEPHMGELGKYSDNTLTGFVGKYDKQVLKIASVLHVANNWVDKNNTSTMVSMETVQDAIGIFSQLINAFINSSEQHGFTGESSAIQACIEKFNNYTMKRRYSIPIRVFVANNKKAKPFNNMRDVTETLKRQILPKLVEYNYCVVANNTIYINPNL